MRFSIVIPAYNAERYFLETLASIETQTYHGFETVIVDDGSTDATPEIADRFASKHENVQVFHGPNRGPLLARRKGVALARGEYVVFLDADDCLQTNALARISEAIDETGADIVAFPFTRELGYANPAQLRDFLETGLYDGERYIEVKKHICKGRFNSLCNKVIRRCCIDLKASYEAFAGLRYGEDLFQLLPIVDVCASFTQLKDVLYYYRPNDASSTAQYKTSQLKDLVQVSHRLMDYAEHWGNECAELAYEGEAIQFINLLKISELSDANSSEKNRNFAEIRNTMLHEGVFRRARSAHLRFDNRMVIFALEHGWHSVTNLIILSVKVVKLWI